MQQVWRCQEFGIFQSAVHKGQRVSMQRRRPQSLSPGNIGRYSLATIKGCQRSRTALHPHAQVHLTAPAIHPLYPTVFLLFLPTLSLDLSPPLSLCCALSSPSVAFLLALFKKIRGACTQFQRKQKTYRPRASHLRTRRGASACLLVTL